MNTKLLKNVCSSLFIAGIATVMFAPAGFCDGALAASSEASCSEGFPVYTGPGNTVLTPDGAYVIPASVQYKEKTPAPPVVPTHKISAEVRNYSWDQKNHTVIWNQYGQGTSFYQ